MPAPAPSSGRVPTPWSKRHKRVTRASSGGLRHSLSNSFANPLTCADLLRLTRERGDVGLVEEYLSHSLGYTPNGGSDDLREEIARHYGHGMGGRDVLVFPGAQVALQTVAQALVGGGGHCITFGPGYQSVVQAPLLAGGRVTTLPLRASDGWGVRLDEVAAAIGPNTRAIWINMPHNPSGTLMSREQQADLIDLADRHGLHILSDEVLRSATLLPSRPLTAVPPSLCPLLFAPPPLPPAPEQSPHGGGGGGALAPIVVKRFGFSCVARVTW